MKTVKQVLRPERIRLVPEQFSWIDQALVQRHLIDRCDTRAATLYLFLVTVADAQGLSYYGTPTLAARLHLSVDELGAARAQLMALDLIAYQAPLYQVLSLTGARTHHSHFVRDYLDTLDGHIQIAFLPPYAPDLNPVEYLWAWLKRHAMANYCPNNLNELHTTARNKLKSAQKRPSIIAACWKQADL